MGNGRENARILQYAVIGFFSLFLIQCQQRSSNAGLSGGTFDPNALDNGYTGTWDPLNPSLGPIGSASNGGLSPADQYALKNVYQEQADVEPQWMPDLSDYLQQQLDQLIADERAGKDVSVQKMMLASKMLEECAQSVGNLGPIPGQPLMGAWQSTDRAACKTSFTVSETGQPGTYNVTGGTRGVMRATNAGDGVMETKPYTEGRLTDRPQAGKGVLTHPQFTKTKYGYDPCSTQVALKTSANPIPKNYQEAMKRMGKCFRRSLVLMSPIFDSMFKNMDPQLSQILQSQMLGISVRQ